MFSLAKELGMTLSTLTREMTTEELVGWAAYFELKNEREEKQSNAIQRTRTHRAR